MRRNVSRLRGACLTTLLAAGASWLTGCVALDAAGSPDSPQSTQTYPPCQYDTCTSTPSRRVVTAKTTVKPKS